MLKNRRIKSLKDGREEGGILERRNKKRKETWSKIVKKKIELKKQEKRKHIRKKRQIFFYSIPRFLPKKNS